MAGSDKKKFDLKKLTDQGSEFFKHFIEVLKSSGGDSVIGLSIGSSSVKLAELKKTGKAWKLVHFAIVPLPEDVIVNRDSGQTIID